MLVNLFGFSENCTESPQFIYCCLIFRAIDVVLSNFDSRLLISSLTPTNGIDE